MGDDLLLGDVFDIPEVISASDFVLERTRVLRSRPRPKARCLLPRPVDGVAPLRYRRGLPPVWLTLRVADSFAMSRDGVVAKDHTIVESLTVEQSFNGQLCEYVNAGIESVLDEPHVVPCRVVDCLTSTADVGDT